MDEAFLHFIWKFQKFYSQALLTPSQEVVHVFHPGHHNHDSGPDFSEARIKIGPIEWNGQVEIHVNSSDWNHHRHTGNPAYENVILHVVWTHDHEIKRQDNTVIPTIELKKFVDPSLLLDYKKYINQPIEILCASHLNRVNNLTWIANLDGMLALRLKNKSERILTLAKEKKYDWEEVAYITLARNFGFSLNADTFEQLALSLPLKTFSKHSDQPRQIEALLFGQAGFLEDEHDQYQIELKQEFDFLKQKYKLDNGLLRVQWKFGKMRPSNFPSVRLAQFSTLLSQTQKLFSLFSELNSIRDFSFKLTLPEYWQSHYDFDKPLKRGSNKLGTSSLGNLIINSIVPVLAAYSLHTDQSEKMNKAIQFLEELPAESNRYTRPFEELKKQAKNAFDSQAQITLYRDFCHRKKCLNCMVGSSLFS